MISARSRSLSTACLRLIVPLVPTAPTRSIPQQALSLSNFFTREEQ